MSDPLNVCMDSNEASMRRDIINYFLLNGINVDVQRLDTCDYVVSDRVGVERKDSSDFLSSMKDGRLFDQAECMSETYERPILVLEGGLEKAFNRSRMRPSSVYGALSSLALDYGISVIPTDCPRSTGVLIHRLAYREQAKEERRIQLRSLKRGMPLQDKQVFLLSGLPQIGTTLAEELLRTFETPQRVLQEFASAEIHISPSGKTKRLLGPLSQVKGVGPVIVENTQEILNLSWNRPNSTE
ncbi:MAG: ERCC4 domain-containing protein [Candidatus Bathyarchaeia archaeon]